MLFGNTAAAIANFGALSGSTRVCLLKSGIAAVDHVCPRLGLRRMATALPHTSTVSHCQPPAVPVSFTAPSPWAVRCASTDSTGGGAGPIPPPPRPPRPRAFITLRSIIGSLVIGGVSCAFILFLKRHKENELEKERRRSLGKASLGGKFSLLDHNGRPCSSDDLLGQWVLLYFGFTHCPDVCPDELEKMAQVVDRVAKKTKSSGVQPVFITVDPYRDDVKAVAKYVSEFHPRLLGLTGTPEQVAEACRAYRVYFSQGPKDDDNDYIVDHTIIMYLIDPEGNFVDYYGQTKSADEVSDSIVFNIVKYNRFVNRSFF